EIEWAEGDGARRARRRSRDATTDNLLERNARGQLVRDHDTVDGRISGIGDGDRPITSGVRAESQIWRLGDGQLGLDEVDLAGDRVLGERIEVVTAAEPPIEYVGIEAGARWEEAVPVRDPE